MTLLTPEQVDDRLNWPIGRARKLARKSRIPHVLLPDGTIRFDSSDVSGMLRRVPSSRPPESRADFARKLMADFRDGQEPPPIELTPEDAAQRLHELTGNSLESCKSFVRQFPGWTLLVLNGEGRADG